MVLVITPSAPSSTEGEEADDGRRCVAWTGADLRGEDNGSYLSSTAFLDSSMAGSPC